MPNPREKGRSAYWIELNRLFDKILPPTSESIYLTNEILRSLANAIAWLIAAAVPDGSQQEIMRQIFVDIIKAEDDHRQNIEDSRLMRGRKYEDPDKL